MALDQTQEWPVFFLGIIMVIMFLFHLSAFGIPTLGQVLSLGRTLDGVSELLWSFDVVNLNIPHLKIAPLVGNL